jgi:NNP family nitrate/nitrite transporter-like MFS transporter
MTAPAQTSSVKRHLALGTFSFTVCFAAWGLIGAFAPLFQDRFGLSAAQVGVLAAVPVLLGALARIPMGILTDRFGGRLVFTVLMGAVAVFVCIVPYTSTYRGLLFMAFWLGLAESSFTVGVGYVSRWASPAQQGSILGVYGLGNIGQSAAVFLGPVLAGLFGWPAVFYGMGALMAVWAAGFAITARNAPVLVPVKSLREMTAVLVRQPRSWILASFYFLTFGGFVAFSIYLPSLLRVQFDLTPADAGFRAAGFVVLATLARPAGGWLSDKIGGARVLSGVLLGIVPFAMLLAWPMMLPFTVGALGCALLLGMGNGAVFKLVPQYFPGEVGTVAGLVGAMGGLGGFFPPLLLGMFLDYFGVLWPGFGLLALTAAALWEVNRRVFLPDQEAFERTLPVELTRTIHQFRAGSWATMWTGFLAAAIVVGSRNMRNFDPALVVYTFATVFALWGVAYHYVVWLQKPPTHAYWGRGWQLFGARGLLSGFMRLAAFATTHLAAQTFIRRRSPLRWWMHQMIFWGCLLAVGITFPLVFGWIHFRTAPDDQMVYVSYLFGFPTFSFRLRTIEAWIIFHLLDIAAVLVLAGIGLSLWRRMREKGAITAQSFSHDFLPLILLFAVSITGLALTVSNLLLRGVFYDFLSILHALTVITTLLYLPFGKLFHIFQRPAQLGIKLYQQAGETDEGTHCARCGERFASRMHIDDLRRVLPEVGFDYTMPGPAGHWQALCPGCKRKTLAAAQLRVKQAAQEQP